MRSGALLCAECGGKLVVNSYYSRTVIESDGSSLKIPIMQTRCVRQGCGKTHAILPHFVIPRKRYAAAVVESAILSYEEKGGFNSGDCPAEDKTMRDWRKQIAYRGRIALGKLSEILLKLYQMGISPIKLMELSIFRQLKVYVLEFKKQAGLNLSGGTVLGAVNVILSTYSSGYI